MSLQLTARFSNVAFWLAQHPTAARIALIVVPIVAALVVALLTSGVALACPPATCGGGCHY